MPYSGEHSCRLKEPNYPDWARKNCYKKHEGKCIAYIFGIKGGKSELQAMRYDIKIWTEADARSHCEADHGSFEPATPKKEQHSTEKEPDRFDIAYGIKNGEAGIFENEQHDKGIGIIKGFSVITKGEIKTHDMIADDITLQQVMELGNKSKIGIKSRFGHPLMSSTALGTFLGRVKNFYIDEDRVRADLFFDETAYDTPNGKLAPYLLKLAKTDPDAFGSSLTGKKDIEEQKNEDGSPKTNEKGKPLFPLCRIKQLSTVDIVDEPAANEGMFGVFFSEGVQFSKEMTEFLDKFLCQPDAVEKTIQFLKRYQVNWEEEDIENQTITIPPTFQGNVAGGTNGRAKEMEMKDITLETLKSDRKDLVEVIEAEAKIKAAQVERDRVKTILMELDSFAAKLEGEPKKAFEAIAKDSIEKGDKEEVALDKYKDEQIKQLQAKAPNSTGVNADPNEEFKNLPDEERWAKEYEKSAELQAEFKDKGAYIAFKKHEKKGTARIIKKSK